MPNPMATLWRLRDAVAELDNTLGEAGGMQDLRLQVLQTATEAAQRIGDRLECALMERASEET